MNNSYVFGSIFLLAAALYLARAVFARQEPERIGSIVGAASFGFVGLCFIVLTWAAGLE